MKWLDRLSNLSARNKRLVTFIGYPLFYLFCLALFFRLLFPYDRLKHTLQTEFAKTQTGPGAMRLEIDRLGSYGLLSLGVRAEGLALVPQASPDASAIKDGQAGSTGPTVASSKPPAKKPLIVEEAHATFGLFSAIWGTTAVKFGANAFDGEVSGALDDSKSTRDLEVELDEVDIGELPLLGDIVGLPFQGRLNGRLALVAPERDIKKADGQVEMVATGIVIGDGKAKIRNTIALPKLNAGTLEMAAEIKKGRLTFEKFSISGGDLLFEAQGTIDLREPFEQSSINLQFEFRFADSYKNKNDVTRGLFGSPGSKIPGAFDLDPQNRRAKNVATGGYGFRLVGLMGNPTTQPDPQAMVQRAGRPTTPAPR